jgi:hypothetical protein
MEQPSLTLSFYSFGATLLKRDGDQVSEYPVDPAQVAVALSAKIRFDTGLLSDSTLLVRQEGVKKTVVDYRAPQKTGLYLDESDTPLRVALPGLLLIRITSEDRNPQYQVYAVKKRPVTLDEPLFHAPIPNVFSNGTICWGTVQAVTDTALKGARLAADWAVLLGSRFNDHGVGGKSKSHPKDIRQFLIALEGRKARSYPKADLLPVKQTLAQVVRDAP